MFTDKFWENFLVLASILVCFEHHLPSSDWLHQSHFHVYSKYFKEAMSRTSKSTKNGMPKMQIWNATSWVHIFSKFKKQDIRHRNIKTS